jgi:hypothetical protein
VDFDLGMRLWKMVCQMSNDDRTSEQVEVFQREIVRWDTQVFVVCEFQ